MDGKTTKEKGLDVFTTHRLGCRNSDKEQGKCQPRLVWYPVTATRANMPLLTGNNSFLVHPACCKKPLELTELPSLLLEDEPRGVFSISLW